MFCKRYIYNVELERLMFVYLESVKYVGYFK